LSEQVVERGPSEGGKKNPRREKTGVYKDRNKGRKLYGQGPGLGATMTSTSRMGKVKVRCVGGVSELPLLEENKKKSITKKSKKKEEKRIGPTVHAKPSCPVPKKTDSRAWETHVEKNCSPELNETSKGGKVERGEGSVWTQGLGNQEKGSSSGGFSKKGV